MITTKPATEDTFIREAMPMIGSIATNVWRQCGKRYELDDHRADGCIGALKAYRAWRPGGLPFAQYVYAGIRNAVYDGVRMMAPMSRRTMRRAQREGLALGDMVVHASTGEWSPCPEADAIEAFDTAVMRREIRRLPRHSGQADAVAATLLAGTFEGAAETLGLNRGSVHRSHRIGVETLRKRMVTA